MAYSRLVKIPVVTIRRNLDIFFFREKLIKLTKLLINIKRETKITVKKMYSQRRVSNGSRNAQVLNDSCLRVTKLKPVSR